MSRIGWKPATMRSRILYTHMQYEHCTCKTLEVHKYHNTILYLCKLHLLRLYLYLSTISMVLFWKLGHAHLRPLAAALPTVYAFALSNGNNRVVCQPVETGARVFGEDNRAPGKGEGPCPRGGTGGPRGIKPPGRGLNPPRHKSPPPRGGD